MRWRNPISRGAAFQLPKLYSYIMLLRDIPARNFNQEGFMSEAWFWILTVLLPLVAGLFSGYNLETRKGAALGALAVLLCVVFKLMLLSVSPYSWDGFSGNYYSILIFAAFLTTGIIGGGEVGLRIELRKVTRQPAGFPE